MKFTMKLLVLLFGVLMLGNVASAQTPREELKQMVEQLQKSPNDNALREKIITLAASVKPAPALPEEVERRMARGAAAFKGATSAADYQDAAKEFEQATLAAPWYGDAYNNLGVAQDKAGNYEAALRSLNLARLASPDSKDIKALIYEVEYRLDKAANSPEKQNERLLVSLNGARFVCRDILAPPGEGNPVARPYMMIDNGSLVFYHEYIFPNGNTKVDSPYKKMMLTGLIPTLTETNTYSEQVTTIKKISDLEIVLEWKVKYKKENGQFPDSWRVDEQVCHRR